MVNVRPEFGAVLSHLGAKWKPERMGKPARDLYEERRMKPIAPMMPEFRAEKGQR
jgi:hypothetical protein